MNATSHILDTRLLPTSIAEHQIMLALLDVVTSYEGQPVRINTINKVVAMS